MTSATREVGLGAVLLALAALGCRGGDSPLTVVVRTDQRFQTIDAWEATAGSPWESREFDRYVPDLIRKGIALGVNRLRLEVRAGVENKVDNFARMRSGALPFRDYRKVWYANTNDDEDPHHINWKGFHFTELDLTVKHMVLPFQAAMAEAGRKLAINVCYVAFTKQSGAGTRYIHDDPEEYAEFMLATLLHLKKTFGLVPETWEILLEPDNVPQWSGELIGRAMVAARKRLDEAGFSTRFIAPSCENLRASLSYADAMARVPGALDSLEELSYHRYRGVGPASLQGLANRARRWKTKAAQLERIGADHRMLREDLVVAQTSSWSRYVLGDPQSRRGGGYFWVDLDAPDGPIVREADGTRFLRRYMSRVPRGSVRIAATSSRPRSTLPTAFLVPDGGCVLVLDVRVPARIRLEGLPQGLYGVEGASVRRSVFKLPDLEVGEAGSAELDVASPAVLTIASRRP